jgi:rsbT co-antagonist protein RsbR
VSGAPSVISTYLATLTGYQPDEIVGNAEAWAGLVHPDDRGRVARELERILEEEQGSIEHRWVTKEGDLLWVESHVRAVKDEQGAPVGLYGVTMDISERKLAAGERQRLKDELIQAREATLIELSNPVLPISPEILVMPIIGTFDAARASKMIETLLGGIWKAQAKVAILDLTGIPGVDESTADALVRAVHAVRLLGTEVVLTGVRPEVSRTLLALGVEGLRGVPVCATLEDGITHAAELRRAKQRRTRRAEGGEAWKTPKR